MNRRQIAAETWNSEEYYQRIERVDDLSHPALEQIRTYCRTAASVLDVGCGDGTKLSRLGKPSAERVGFEISQAGIKRGRKKYPNINFVSGKDEQLHLKPTGLTPSFPCL